MTPDQKRQFYNDGFLIFRDIVPNEIVVTAARAFHGQLSAVWGSSMAMLRNLDSDEDSHFENWKKSVEVASRTGVDPSILALAAPGSELVRSIEEALGGTIRSFRGAQLATLFPHEPTNHINESGYYSQDVPFYGWHGHLDGLWNGSAPVHQRTDRPMNSEELQAWSKDLARNGVRKSFPESNSTISNFTALLGIPLSDQMIEGCGNLGLLKGAHHHIERFFQHQRELGGPLGPDGPDWERIDTEAPNKSGLRHYPEVIREQFKADAAFTSDNRIWPKPTLINVKPGDAVLALHAIPHCSTRNESYNPRIMAYFRIVPESRPREFFPSYPDALCDCWLEWKGMQDTVREERVKTSN